MKKKNLCLVFFCFISPVIYGQDTLIVFLNDSTYTRTISDNGRFISLSTIRVHLHRESEAFLFDKGLLELAREGNHFLSKKEIILYEKENIYGANNRLISTRVFDREKKSPVSVSHFIPENMISLDIHSHSLSAPTESVIEIPAEITSFSFQKICLSIRPYASDSICIEPHLKMRVNYRLSIKKGVNTDTLLLCNDSIRKVVPVSLFGYTLCSDDFEKAGKISLEREIFYYRSGTEALLNIYKKINKEPLKRIPLSHYNNTISLRDLKPGKYVFETVDYTLNLKKRVTVELISEK